MNKPFLEIDTDHFSLGATDTIPIDGYEVPINLETGEKFPDCCLHHKQIFEVAESWFEKFPECCEKHKQMSKLWWFKKNNYIGISKIIVTKVSYTEYHISKQINNTDWYEDITDYIEYTIFSFGQPAIGLDIYFNSLKQYITHKKDEFPKEKMQKLLEYMNLYYRTPGSTKTDLNILYSTYQDWLKAFPFELTSYFGNLKEQFEDKLPILNGPIEVNRYSKLAKAIIHTKSSLFDALVNLTNELLTKINGTVLFENGLITDTNKIKLELANSRRKLKLTKGYSNSSPDEEHRYRKIIKDWLKDEKDYFNEISPLLKTIKQENMHSQIEPIKFMEFKKSSFYSNLLEGNNFTKDEADELYQFIIDTIKLLEKIRSDELKSHNLIIDRAKSLDKNPIFDRISRMFQSWLVKALANDDTYFYAFNYLAQKTNREMHQEGYKVKFISDTDLYFLLQKEKDQQSISSALKLSQSEPVIIKNKLTLKEYKDKLDFSLSYYSNFFLVVNAIILKDYEGVVDGINDLNENGVEVAYNEKSLTEQVHFDLNTEEATIYFNYGIRKINEILETFHLITARINDSHDEVSFNKDIHEIWHEQSNLGWGFVLYSDSTARFVKDLVESIEKNILNFKDKFISSTLLNANIKINQPQLNDGKQITVQHLSTINLDSKQNIDQPINSTSHNPSLVMNENIKDEVSLKHIKDTIADHMEDFRSEIPLSSDFEKACLELQLYFENKPNNISKPIFIKNGNITKLAYELGSVFKELKNEAFSKEYLSLLIRLFSIYQKENIDSKPLTSTRLYKYLTSKS